MAQKKEDFSKERQDLYEMFQMFDEDNSGEISSDEFLIVMRAMNMNPTKKEIESMMPKGKTVLNFDEFCELVTKRKETVDESENLIQAFKTFDKDGNGYLSRDELYELLGPDTDEAMKVFDQDGDGQIDYKEFVAILNG